MTSNNGYSTGYAYVGPVGGGAGVGRGPMSGSAGVPKMDDIMNMRIGGN